MGASALTGRGEGAWPCKSGVEQALTVTGARYMAVYTYVNGGPGMNPGSTNLSSHPSCWSEAIMYERPFSVSPLIMSSVTGAPPPYFSLSASAVGSSPNFFERGVFCTRTSCER